MINGIITYRWRIVVHVIKVRGAFYLGVLVCWLYRTGSKSILAAIWARVQGGRQVNLRIYNKE
jgi:hypothetical protein